MGEKEPFTKVMKKATRGIHNISDALINAKLGIAMSDDKIWAEGLLVFYEVFKHLESAIDRLKGTVVEQLDIEGMRRTQAFEKDLDFYLGSNWRSIPLHESVTNYLSYLTDLEETNPTLLLAYIYHLYMGLFAGGQILKKKREMVLKLSFTNRDGRNEGLAVVNLDRNIYHVKREMSDAMNRVCDELSEDVKLRLIEESKNVFVMNNKMVASIQGTNWIIVNKLFKMASVGALFAVAYYFYFYKR